MDGPLNSSRDINNRSDENYDNIHNQQNNNRHQTTNDVNNHRNNNRSHRPRSRSRSRDKTSYNHTSRNNGSSSSTFTTNKTDPDLPQMNDDPRSSDPSKRITKKALSQTKGRNTESFHAESTFVRPDLRVQIGSGRAEKYEKKLKHDDVVIVPELFGDEDDWTTYYQLVKELREIQEQEKSDGKENENNNNNNNGGGRRGRGPAKSEWIPWHEGAHLISKKPDDSPTYQRIIKRLCEYFDIDMNKPVGTRFNWYRDSNDWKPFHHDSAAFNAGRARSQNITIGASFGSMRELAFIRTKPYALDDTHSGRGVNHHNDGPENKCKLYFPQNNNGVFSFGRDANIHWKHGINALPPDEHDGKGRISIILWGFAKNVIEEDNSPPLLGSDGTGPHAARGGHHRRSHHHGRMDDRRSRDDNWRSERQPRHHRDDYHWNHRDGGRHNGNGARHYENRWDDGNRNNQRRN